MIYFMAYLNISVAWGIWDNAVAQRRGDVYPWYDSLQEGLLWPITVLYILYLIFLKDDV